MKIRRFALVILALALFAGGCASAPAQPDAAPPATTAPAETALPDTPAPDAAPPADAGEGMRFTDSLGREVTLPQPLERLIPATRQAQAALYALSPALLADWGGTPHSIRVGAKEYLLPAGELSDIDWSEQDLSPYLQSNAQAMLIMGTGMDAAALERVQEEVGMPVLYLDAGYEALAMSYLALGGLFGLEQEAQDIYLYLDTSLMELSDGTREIPEDQRRSVFYGEGESGLIASGSDAVLLAGGVNAAQPGTTYTVEGIEALDADLLVFSSGGVYASVMESKEWNALEAVQMGLYYEIPFKEFDWLGSANRAEQILGAKWLASLMYPDGFVYDMVEETRMFYDLFYHVQMTSEEAEALLENSSLKPIG